MEQYWMPAREDWTNLRYCLDTFPAEHLFIRLVGSQGGTVKIDESLENRRLDIRKQRTNLHFLIDDSDIFKLSMEKREQRQGVGFSVAYERILHENHHKVLYLPQTGVDPYNPELPEPKHSILRHVLNDRTNDHLLEITFTGRLPLEFHSWQDKIRRDWKLWTIKKD